MPIVTISMNDKAYQIYRNWEKGLKSSRVSAAIQLWQAQVLDHKYTEHHGKVEE
jgi:hypothetical protein